LWWEANVGLGICKVDPKPSDIEITTPYDRFFCIEPLDICKECCVPLLAQWPVHQAATAIGDITTEEVESCVLDCDEPSFAIELRDPQPLFHRKRLDAREHCCPMMARLLACVKVRLIPRLDKQRQCEQDE